MNHIHGCRNKQQKKVGNLEKNEKKVELVAKIFYWKVIRMVIKEDKYLEQQTDGFKNKYLHKTISFWIFDIEVYHSKDASDCPRKLQILCFNSEYEFYLTSKLSEL